MIPSWAVVGFVAVLIGVIGTLFDKYLLGRYFYSYDDENAGPGALMIFSSYFAILVVVFVFLTGYKNIDFSLSYGLLGLLAGVLNGLWILMYLYAINRTELSRAVPIFQIIPAFGLILGYLTIGEVIHGSHIFAAALIIIGALVLLYVPGNSFFKIDFITLILMVGASFLVALSQTIFKIISIATNYTTASFWLWAGFALLGIVFYLCIASYQREFDYLISERIKSVFALNSYNEIFDNLYELVMFAAIIIGPIALVQSINAYEPLLILAASVGMTKLFPSYFDEEISKMSFTQKILGILLITIASLYFYILT